jgi:hypothetical protein
LSPEDPALPVMQRCRLFGGLVLLVYRQPDEVSEQDGAIMALIDCSIWPGPIMARAG